MAAMTARPPLLIAALLLAACAHAPSGPATPYAGQQSRDIKSLSAEEVADLLAGKGMGFAKPAELNGYPGPAHVLELADQLALTPAQRRRTEELFTTMQQRARAEGSALVEEERALDRLFASRAIDAPSLEAALARIAALQARVRAAHLEAHLSQAQILEPAQMARYAELRGYGAGHSHRH
jgi:Spy/CpxP family protein refolding chaperone